MSPNQSPANPKAREALQEALDRILPFPSALRLWERVLTESERERLGGDVEAAFRERGPIGMWMHLHGVTPHRAIVDIAHLLGFLSPTDAVWLLREIDADVDNSPPSARPHWDHIQGELLLGGKVIRRLRLTSHATNLQKILDAFEKSNWTPRIANPLSRGQHQLHEALRSLNRTLKRIRFHAMEGGKAIRWSMR